MISNIIVHSGKSFKAKMRRIFFFYIIFTNCAQTCRKMNLTIVAY